MTGIKNYRTTASLNGNVFSTGTAIEGMPPSSINDCLRQMAKDTKDWYLNAEWIEVGNGETAVTPTRVSGTQITISADVTTAYHTGRRIKLVDGTGTTLYGTITLSAYNSPNTTVTISWDSGSIGSGTITSIMLGITSAINTSAPTNIPVGGIIIWTQSALPNGFLLANGSLVNKVDYPALFTALGNNFGNATSTQFYLPNLTDKFVIGKGSTYSTLGGTGGTSTLTPTGSNSALTFSGNAVTPSGSVSVSVNNHTLTIAQIPSHFHVEGGVQEFGTTASSTASTSRNTGHAFPGKQYVTQSTGGGGSHSHGSSGSFSGNSFTPSGSINTPTFTGNSASIINPYIAMSYIIKT